jgi:hypothetical protein
MEDRDDFNGATSIVRTKPQLVSANNSWLQA